MSSSATSIEAIIASLASRPHEPRVHNPYFADNHLDNARRRQNLRIFLSQILTEQSQPALLVCEAPGYRGCRLTGVPLCSRKIMLGASEGAGIFGRERGFRDTQDDGYDHILGEQSATIVWNELYALGISPLVWNAFPWHPHQPGLPLSNRKPSKAELRSGLPLLESVVSLTRSRRVLAIGRSAEFSLQCLGVAHEAARHPAHGGKASFITALQRFAHSLASP